MRRRTCIDGLGETGPALLRLLLVVAALLAVLAPAGLRAESSRPASAEIVTYGEFRTVPRTAVQAAPDTSAGVIGLSNGRAAPEIVARTGHITATLGVTFGIEVAAPGLAGDRTLPVTVRLDHPALTAPDGRVWRTETFPSQIRAGSQHFTFCFDHAWELASGDWTYTILHEDRPVASQAFTVTVDRARQVDSRCGPEDAVS